MEAHVDHTLRLPPIQSSGWLQSRPPHVASNDARWDHTHVNHTPEAESCTSAEEDDDDGSVLASLQHDAFENNPASTGPHVTLASLNTDIPPSRRDSYAVVVTSPWVYELLPSHDMPPIDLSKTPLRNWSPPSFHGVIVDFLRIHYLKFALVYRIGTVSFFGLLFISPGPIRGVFQALVLIAMIPVLTTLALSSLDLLKMIIHNHEFAFISVINLINWVLFAATLGPPLAYFCFSPWMALQTIIMVDLNYRTYPTALKSILASIPALAIVAVYTQLGRGENSRTISIQINGRPLMASDIIAFTASNLVIFLLKKNYLKRTTTHPHNAKIKVISCVVIRANVELVLTNHPGKVNARRIFSRVFTRKGGKPSKQPGHAVPAARPPGHPSEESALLESSSIVTESARNGPDVQQLRITRLKRSHVDATRTIALCVAPTVTSPLRFAKWKLVCLYFAGLVGFGASVALSVHGLWFLQLQTSEQQSTRWLFRHLNLNFAGAISLIGSCVFCGTFAMGYQRELVHWLLHNFDFWFSAFQVVSLAWLLSDMMRWHRICIVNFTWCVWFLWILSLDALTPVMKTRFAFTKRLATLPMLMILLGSLWIFTLLFFFDSNLTDRELLVLRLGAARVDFRSQPMIVGRIFTIIGWSTRLVWALAVRREHELMLIRGRVEYMSEYETFPVREAIEARRAAKLAKHNRRTTNTPVESATSIPAHNALAMIHRLVKPNAAQVAAGN